MRGEDPQEVLNAMAQGLTNKFLHGSLHALQHASGSERDALIKLLPKLFATHSGANSFSDNIFNNLDKKSQADSH